MPGDLSSKVDRPKSSDSGERSPLPLDLDFPTKEIVSEENGIKVITKVYETPDGRSKTVTKKSITEAEDGSSSTVTTVTRKTIVSGGRTFKFELDPKGPANVDDVNVEVPLVEEKVKPKHSTPPPALPKTPPPSQLPDNPLKSQPSPPIQSSPPPAQPKKSPPKSSPTILPVIPSQTKTPTTPPAPQPQKETPAASPSILPSLSPVTTTPNKPSPPSSPSKAPVKKKSEKVLEIAPVQPKVKKDWSNRPKYFGTSLESDVVAEKEIQKTKLRRQQSLQEPIVLTKNQELKAKKIQVAAAGLPRYKKMREYIVSSLLPYQIL
ncbi:hypothetical protein CAPTEDRAFT_193341 [Capitella teleta]|uniref:Uncharacterized protein n=1 Tax=Capitella teleta TaxID=283909 RepID=R7UV99_CAPTE|nr:hypothetical protein CAPTEDRAFT_193341 [Capitella teleta]|eukprot:ELU10043.1 hypothetical protein CAPTEDRAFT_193341 [Capitella teleta]